MNIKLGLSAFASIVTCAFFSSSASAQQELNLRAEGVRPYTIELKPLPTAITAVGNGAGSAGVGAEFFIQPKVAIYVDGSYTDLDMPNNLVQRAKDDNPNEAVPDSLIGYSVVPGLRYYGSPEISSWYGQLGVGYAETKGKFQFRDTEVDSRAISVLPTLAFGYRWLFRNNVLIRFGAGAAANLLQSHKETATTANANSAAAEGKVNDLVKTPVLAAVDLGLGYAF